MSIKAKTFIAAVVLVGLTAFGAAILEWRPQHLAQFVCYLGIAMMASGLKITLPEINGTMSVNFLFVLLGLHELGFAQTMALGLLSALVQIFWTPRVRPRPIHVIFNLCSMAAAIAAAFLTYHFLGEFYGYGPLPLIAAAVTYFLANTVPVAVIISLTEQKPLSKIWRECYFWSFPYYLLGGAIASLVGYLNSRVGWQTSLLVLPSVYVIYRSYRLYLSKLEDEKRHVEEMASLHLRTIEALALAIEAKDHTTHDHLQRVRIYAMEVAKELNVSPEETEALRAAALLHDIGKLAVPEHIINKPGRLTPEEFEKMKIHPLIGAEILEQVQFPYPVVPIVRSHHEKVDGTGYPNGLKGEEIPIGARILSASG